MDKKRDTSPEYLKLNKLFRDFISDYEKKQPNFIENEINNTIASLINGNLLDLKLYINKSGWNNAFINVNYPIKNEMFNNESISILNIQEFKECLKMYKPEKYIKKLRYKLKRTPEFTEEFEEFRNELVDQEIYNDTVFEVFEDYKDVYILSIIGGNGIFTFPLEIKEIGLNPIFTVVVGKPITSCPIYLGVSFKGKKPKQLTEKEIEYIWNTAAAKIKSKFPNCNQYNFCVCPYEENKSATINYLSGNEIEDVISIPCDSQIFNVVYSILAINKFGYEKDLLGNVTLPSERTSGNMDVKIMSKINNDIKELSDEFLRLYNTNVQQTFLYILYLKNQNDKYVKSNTVIINLNDFFSIRSIKKTRENIDRLIMDLGCLSRVEITFNKTNYKGIKGDGILLAYEIIYKNPNTSSRYRKQIKYFEVILGNWISRLTKSYVFINSNILKPLSSMGTNAVSVYLKLIERYRNNALKRNQKGDDYEIILCKSIVKIMNIAEQDIIHSGFSKAIQERLEKILDEYFHWEYDLKGKKHTIKKYTDFLKTKIKYKPKSEKITKEISKISKNKKKKPNFKGQNKENNKKSTS